MKEVDLLGDTLVLVLVWELIFWAQGTVICIWNEQEVMKHLKHDMDGFLLGLVETSKKGLKI